MLGPLVAAIALVAPSVQRWYEVDLRANGGEAPTASSGLTLEELARELAAQRFDGLLLWLPAPLAADLPPEPRAREFARAALPPALAALLPETLEPSLRVALGAAAPAEIEVARKSGAPSFHAIWIEGTGLALELFRVERPAVTTLLWCDPAWRSDGPPFTLSERPLLAASAELRLRQARLDLAAFGAGGDDGVRDAAQRAGIEGPALDRLRLQSRLASNLTRHLAGATPERCDALANT